MNPTVNTSDLCQSNLKSGRFTWSCTMTAISKCDRIRTSDGETRDLSATSISTAKIICQNSRTCETCCYICSSDCIVIRRCRYFYTRICRNTFCRGNSNLFTTTSCYFNLITSLQRAIQNYFHIGLVSLEVKFWPT